jgi:U11/U12 small nuclear ribonucleoprotein SNRNP31
MDKKLSPELNPTLSTVYVSNLSYNLTNNDLNKIFEKFGRIIKVTICKQTINEDNKRFRRSKGVAFIFFLEPESALNCVNQMNGKEVMGRVINCSIAKDNGRAQEFNARRNYSDKSRCYECGDFGHLSYNCLKNSLGDRIPLKKKKKNKKSDNKLKTNPFVCNKRKTDSKLCFDENEDKDYDCVDDEEEEDPYLESLSAAIQYEQQLNDSRNESFSSDHNIHKKKRKIHKSTYFSDEEIEEESDD